MTSAGGHRRSASRLASDGLPSMPPELVGRYAARIRGLAADLDALAGDLVRAGANLDLRARLAEASQAGATTTTVASIPAPPPQLPVRAPRIPTVTLPQGGGRARCSPTRSAHGSGAPPHPVGAASQQDVACWLAAQSRSAGAPGELLVMAALTESGGKNLAYGDRDSVGYFQIRPSTNFAPAGFGIPPETKVSGDWWVEHPDAQAAWAREKIEATAGGARDADSPTRPRSARGRRRSSGPPTRTATRSTTPGARARQGLRRPQEPRGRKSVLKIAAKELGVQETGTTRARASPSTRSAPAPTTRPGARASSRGRSSSPAIRCPRATGRRSPTTSAPRRPARRAWRSSAPPTPAPAISCKKSHGSDFGSDRPHRPARRQTCATVAFSRRSRATTRTRSPTRRAPSNDANIVFIRVASSVEVFELTVDYGAEELSALGRLLGAGDAPGLDRARPRADVRRHPPRRARRRVARPGRPPRARDRARPAAVVRGHRAAREPARAADRARARAHARPLDADAARRRWTIYLREDRGRRAGGAARACSTATR